jgi:hypothetical protein
MLSNKTYRFIFVILTLREGKRFVSFVPTEVNRSNERQEHLRNLVLFCFTLVLPNKRNELLNQLRKKEMWLRLVNNLLLPCLPMIVIQVPHWWLHYLKHSPSFEGAMCRSHNVFRYVLQKISFLVMCFTTTYLFMKQQALFVNMTERFQIYLPCIS